MRMAYRKANRDNSAPENEPDNGGRHTKAGDDQARAVDAVSKIRLHQSKGCLSARLFAID
jgi:hypothetical protein